MTESEYGTANPWNYLAGFWWIDTIQHTPRQYYPYRVQGRNAMKGGEPFSWRIPNLKGAFVFTLRVIE
jgi:hypothetical protein